MPWTYDQADCGLRALEVDRLAEHWLRDLPLEVLVIDYEELVTDLPAESRRLIEFLGLESDPACLEFHPQSGRSLPRAVGRSANPYSRIRSAGGDVMRATSARSWMFYNRAACYRR